jgi:hypothetical protein
MKKILLLFVLAGLCLSAKADTTNRLAVADTIVWAGLDYSLAKMVGDEKTNTFYSFAKQKNIFPGTLDKWNRLFLDDQLDSLSKELGKKFIIDIKGVKSRNELFTKNQLVLSANAWNETTAPNVTLIEVVEEVHQYQMEQTGGIGLVFIVDKLSEQPQYSNKKFSFGAVYVVFFDIATRQLLHANRFIFRIQNAGSFENFWFGPIKDAGETLAEVIPSKIKKPASDLNRARGK